MVWGFDLRLRRSAAILGRHNAVSTPTWAATAARRRDPELSFTHLADTHRKIAVADPPRPTDVTVDRNIVWRIGADQIDNFIAEKRCISARFARVAADELMPAEQPK